MEEKDKKEKDIEVNFKNILLAGIGAIATASEKSKELFNELALKGGEAVEKGKVLNEELKHKVEDTLKDNIEVKVVKEELNSTDDIMSAISSLNEEELKELKNKIENLNKKEDK